MACASHLEEADNSLLSANALAATQHAVCVHHNYCGQHCVDKERGLSSKISGHKAAKVCHSPKLHAN